jgi:hypothetical protein
MTKIQVYDPALCCSTGICGVDVDQEKVALAGRYPRRVELAKWAKIHLAVTDTQQGVERLKKLARHTAASFPIALPSPLVAW